MKTKSKLILSALIVFAALTMRPTGCNAGTEAARDTIPAFSFDILPEIERDLALCDLYKERIPLLVAQVAQRTAERDAERNARVAAEQQLKKEKRKRIVGNVLRTVAEIAVFIVVIKTL